MYIIISQHIIYYLTYLIFNFFFFLLYLEIKEEIESLILNSSLLIPFNKFNLIFEGVLNFSIKYKYFTLLILDLHL